MHSTDNTSEHSLSLMESAPGPITVIAGSEYLYFAGTGYLGLQSHPEVQAEAAAGVYKYGVHSATTRAGFGNSPPVLEVERRSAEFMGAGAACYLVTGYAGNFALAAAVRTEVEIALVDEAAHDCLREATRWLDLTRPPILFRHRDAGHLAELLKGEITSGQRPLVLTDGVFAASGRIAPLNDYLTILEQYAGAKLLVDDAHGVGVLGENGRGSLEVAGCAPVAINSNTARVSVLQSITLSKAIGGHGGALAASRAFTEQVRSASGWYRGASAPAAPVAAATAKALELVQTHPELRCKLASNITYARQQLRSLGLDIEDFPSAIVSCELDSADEMQRVQQSLLSAGIAIAYTRDYAGAGANGMLRIAIFATHTQEMIDQLVATLRSVL